MARFVATPREATKRATLNYGEGVPRQELAGERNAGRYWTDQVCNDVPECAVTALDNHRTI